MEHTNLVGRSETWLMQEGLLHRPMTRKALTEEEFEQQKRDEVEYTVFRRITGTWSDGKGGRSGWKRV